MITGFVIGFLIWCFWVLFAVLYTLATTPEHRIHRIKWNYNKMIMLLIVMVGIPGAIGYLV